MRPVRILGASVAALVATERLLAAGVPVELCVAGRCAFDFHVLPDGRRVEAGCRLLELDYGDPPEDGYQARFPELADYRAGSAHGHRPYMGLIDAYVRSLIEVGDPVERSVQRGAFCTADPFLSGDPASVPGLLSDEEREIAAFQLAAIIRRPDTSATTFLAAARATAGDELFEAVVWPVAHKILGWRDVDVWDRRKVWMPLWRPVGLLAALEDRPLPYPVRPMFEGCGRLVDALAVRVRPALREVHGWVEPDLVDWSQVPHLYDPASDARTSIDLVWYEDGGETQQVMWWVDPSSPMYRESALGAVVCAEVAHGAAWEPGWPVLDRKTVNVALSDPVVDDPKVIGFGPLNEQIVQGLAAADRLVKERA